MSYYRTCSRCGMHLDPGEVCDCVKKELPSVATTEQPETEQGLTDHVSTDSIRHIAINCQPVATTESELRLMTSDGLMIAAHVLELAIENRMDESYNVLTTMEYGDAVHFHLALKLMNARRIS